jgi:predicted nucleotide-binding protein
MGGALPRLSRALIVLLQAAIDLVLGLLTRIAIFLLEHAEQFVCLPSDVLEGIIGEPAPPRPELSP